MIDGLIFCGHWISRSAAAKTRCTDPRGIKNENIPRLIFQHFDLQPGSQTVAQTRKDLFSTAKTCKALRNLLWTRSGTFYPLSYHFSCFCPPPKSICEFYLIRVLSIESVTYCHLFFYEVRRRASFDRWLWLGATWCTCLSSRNTLMEPLHIEISTFASAPSVILPLYSR